MYATAGNILVLFHIIAYPRGPLSIQWSVKSQMVCVAPPIYILSASTKGACRFLTKYWGQDTSVCKCVWKCILFISFEFWWIFVEKKRCWQCCEKGSILAMPRSCISNNYHKCSWKFLISQHETSQHAQLPIYAWTWSGLQPQSSRLQVQSHTLPVGLFSGYMV